MEGQNSVVFQRVIGSLGGTIEPHKDGYFGRGYEYECEREVDADVSPGEECMDDGQASGRGGLVVVEERRMSLPSGAIVEGAHAEA